MLLLFEQLSPLFVLLMTSNTSQFQDNIYCSSRLITNPVFLWRSLQTLLIEFFAPGVWFTGSFVDLQRTSTVMYVNVQSLFSAAIAFLIYSIGFSISERTNTWVWGLESDASVGVIATHLESKSVVFTRNYLSGLMQAVFDHGIAIFWLCCHHACCDCCELRSICVRAIVVTWLAFLGYDNLRLVYDFI